MSGYLTDSISSSGSRTTFTISAWVKIDGKTANQTIFGAGTAGTNTGKFYFAISNGQVRIGGGANVYLVTNRVFRDSSSWYHLVVAYDSTQGTAANRIKFYVNGVQETSFSTSSYPSQDLNGPVNESGKINTFGAEQGGGESWDGYMTHMVLVDGAQLTASNFGETDSTTGEWKPKADPTGVTYGTNGVFMKCENSGNFGLDSSGNGNNYTATSFPTGAHTTDCASNNFCTLSPLAQNPNLSLGLASGNTQSFDTNNGNFRPCGATMCFTKGKWYFETKYSGAGSLMVGLFDADNSTAQAIWSGTGDRFAGYNSGGNGFSYRENGILYTNGNTTSGKTSWSSNGDFLGLAIDCDNNAIYAHVNGTYVDSGDPTSGASRTGSLSNFTQTGFMMPMVSVSAASFNGGYHNFGNPGGDSGVTNSNTDANGYGKFQYAVPSGYYALCTKNLAEYG